MTLTEALLRLAVRYGCDCGPHAIVSPRATYISHTPTCTLVVRRALAHTN